MPYQVRSFGGLSLLDSDGEQINAVQAHTKRAAVLAYLATHPAGEAVDRGELLPLLWAEHTEKEARNSLRAVLTRLRDRLPDEALGGKGENRLWLRGSVVTSDVRAFQQALQEGRPRDALDLYRGPFLEHVHISNARPFNRWAEERRSAYRRRAYQAALTVGQEAYETGELAEAERAYRQALDLEPLKEEAAAGLIRALGAQGERTDALKLYEAFSERLEEELDLSPSEELEELAERIRSEPEGASTEESARKGGGAPVESAVDHAGADKGLMARPQLSAPAVLLTLALIGAAVWWGGRSAGEPAGGGSTSAAGPERPTIAVFPFQNLSGNEEARPFVRGVHSELLTRLSSVDGLAVMSRSSVGPYRDTELTLSAVADSLGVEWILEGGVQQSGNRIRVNAQLIDPDTDTHVWAASYEQELTAENLFRIQEELTRKIVRALDVELTPEDERQVAAVPTPSTAAYELYLQAKAIEEEGPHTDAANARKIRLFRRALELDSTFAGAWAGLADALVDRSWSRRWSTAWADSALAVADRALKLDPELARAHIQLGDAHWVLGNTERQLEAYRRAWQLNPDLPGVTNNLITLLDRQGRYAEKLKWLDRALRTSPQPANQVGTLVETNVLLGRESVADAWREYARRRELTLTETEFTVALLYRGEVDRATALLGELADGEETVNDIRRRALVELYEGDWKQARGLYRRLYSASGRIYGLFDDRIGLAWSLDRLGQTREARKISERVREDATEAIDSGVPMPAVRHRLAVAHLLLGDTANSLEWLEAAVDAGGRRLPVLETAPTLDPLRNYPRFQALMDRVANALAAERRQAERNSWGEPPESGVGGG